MESDFNQDLNNDSSLEHQKSRIPYENVGNTSLLTDSTNQVQRQGSDGVVHSSSIFKIATQRS